MADAVQLGFVQVDQVNVRPFVGVQVEGLAFVHQNLDAQFLQLIEDRLDFVAVGVVEERQNFALVQPPGAASLFDQLFDRLGPVVVLPVVRYVSHDLQASSLSMGFASADGSPGW